MNIFLSNLTIIIENVKACCSYFAFILGIVLLQNYILLVLYDGKQLFLKFLCAFQQLWFYYKALSEY